MFDRASSNSFKNRKSVGDFVDISFEIASESDRSQIESIEASIHYLKFGEGEPLLLLHGLGQSLYTWRKLFWMLEKNFEVYAIDMPGHGCSEKAAMAYAVEDFSLSIETFMMKLGIESAHIVAFGEAATYAMDLAEQSPDKVRSLILVSPLIESGDDRGQCFSPFIASCSRFMFSQKNFDMDLESWFFDKTLVTDELLDEYFFPYRDKEMKALLKVAGANYNDIEVKENIIDIEAPMLIVRGTNDKLSPPMDQGLGGLPGLRAKAFNIRNCGWLVQEEKPEKLCAAINQFISIGKPAKQEEPAPAEETQEEKAEEAEE